MTDCQENHCSGGKVRILVVDDDYDALEWSRLVLEHAGYDVVCCIDTQTARDSIGERRPDLIISDLMMDALDAGFAFARTLKADEETAAIPILMLTAASSRHGFDFSPRSEADLDMMGVDAFFSKPVDPGALKAKIGQLLRQAGSAPPLNRSS